MPHHRLSPTLVFAVGWISAAGLLAVGSREFVSRAAAYEPRPVDEDNVTTLMDEPEFAIRVVHRRRVRLGEPDWIRLEFQNKLHRPLKVSQFQCRIEAVAYRLDNGMRHPTTSRTFYIQGPTLWDLMEDRPRGPGEQWERTVPARETRSDSACLVARLAANLELPPEPGVRVEGKWTMTVNLSPTQPIKMKDGTKTIHFEWLAPKPTELAGINNLTRRLVRNDSIASHEYELRLRMLSDSRTSSTVTVEDVAAGIRRGQGTPVGASDIVRFAADRFAGSQPAGWAEVVEAIRESIKAKDRMMPMLLKDLPTLWHESYAVDLAESCIPYDNERRFALELLGKHSAEWKDKRELSQRLSADVKRHWSGVLEKPPSELPEQRVNEWAQAVKDLSHANDPELVPLIAAGLDDTRRLRLTANDNSSTLMKQIMPLRVCDAALDSILRLLDGPIEPIYKPRGLYDPAGSSENYTTLQKRFDDTRDRMIVELKKRLAEK